MSGHALAARTLLAAADELVGGPQSRLRPPRWPATPRAHGGPRPSSLRERWSALWRSRTASRPFCSPRRPPRRRPSTGVIRREPAERTRLSDTRNTVDHIIFQGERSPSLTHKRTKRQPAIAAGLNAPRRNRVGRQHGWPADVPSAEQRRAQRQRDLEAIRRAYAEMVATSHEIDDDTAELALLSMHLDDEQRRLEAGMKLGWHPYHFPDEPDSKQ